jgi:hypothetical protein
MVADGGLRNVAAGGEVAGADVVGRARQLTQDRQPRGVCSALEQERIGIDETFHIHYSIDNHRYRQVSI